MKVKLFIVLVTIFLSACGANNSNTSSPAAGKKPAVGDAVVAKTKFGSFAEGKIQSIDGQKAKIAFTNKDLEPFDSDLAEVYQIPKAGDPPKVKAGDYAIANITTYNDGYWTEVQITDVSGAEVGYKQMNGYSYKTSPEKVIAVSSAESVKIKGEYDSINKKQEFLDAANKAKPTIPEGYKPKVGDTVVAQGPAAWDTGQVKSITGDKATILWDKKNNSTFDTTFDKIVPLPAAGNSTIPSVNDFVIIKYSDPAWVYARVNSVNGKDIAVTDEFNETKTVKSGDFIALKS